jgi:hypothetical protein
MITAEQLSTLTHFSTHALENSLEHSGHKGYHFESAEFVGITNGGEFAYKVTYLRDDAVQLGKVFLQFDPTVGRVSASM